MVRPSEKLVNPSGGRIPKRRNDNRWARLASQAGNHVLAIVAAVTSIAEFVGLVVSKQLRNFVATYPYPICISLIIALLAFLVTLNYAQAVRKQRDQFEIAADQHSQPRPSAHDMRLFVEVLAELPLDGPVITWLRRANMVVVGPAGVPADVLTALERTVRCLEKRPVGFDDDTVARALANFVAAIDNYRTNLEIWTLALHSASPSDVAGRLLSDDTDPMTGVLGCSQRQLLQAYDSFIVTAHQRGMDVEH
jgi:hypothetical protein